MLFQWNSNAILNSGIKFRFRTWIRFWITDSDVKIMKFHKNLIFMKFWKIITRIKKISKFKKKKIFQRKIMQIHYFMEIRMQISILTSDSDSAPELDFEWRIQIWKSWNSWKIEFSRKFRENQKTWKIRKIKKYKKLQKRQNCEKNGSRRVLRTHLCSYEP